MNSALPAGPRMPAAMQLLGSWTRPTAFLESCRARYGKRFTLRFPLQPPFVVLSDPEEIKEAFTAPADVLHPGEGAVLLEPIVGANSVILLDEAPHLEQRKLMLPAFHGERMERLTGLVRELADREIASWPSDEEIELHPRLQQLTLEIILRAVFGLEQGERLNALRDMLTTALRFTESPLSLIPLSPGIERVVLGRGPVARLIRLREQADAMIFELIDERRRDEQEGRTDVLAMLLEARHEDGSPMSPQELRDELMTALVAGHETTASQLAWAFSELSHEPAIERRLGEEASAGEEDTYLAATINEVMRRRPVLPNAEPRLVKKPVAIGPVEYPEGVVLIANAYLVHHDPAIYPNPYELRPERFLERQPGTYTWLPFGGGRRRCLGASFAQLEMKVVLGSALARYGVRPASARREVPRRRSITISPSLGARVILERREAAAVSVPRVEAAVPAQTLLGAPA